MNMLIAIQSARNGARRARGLRALHWFGQWGALGIFAVAVVDFSIVPLPLPNVTDLLLLWLVSHGGSAWALVPSAVAGGIVGAYTTWHVGWKGGRPILRRYRSLSVLEPILQWMERHPISSALLLPLLPPPIPLAPLVLACGAIGIPRRRFFAAFTVALSVRYVVIAWLAETYGRHVLRLWARVLREWSGPLLWIVVTLLLGAAAYSIWRTYIRNRCTRSKTEAVEVTASVPD